MHKTLILLTFAALGASALACSAPASSDAEMSEGEISSSARNTDVQVLKLYDAPSFSISKGSIYPSLDQEACKPEGMSWSEIKAWDTAASGYLHVTLDCTDAFTQKYGYPSMRAVRIEGYRTKRSEEAYYGYVGFSNGGGAFWTKTVELVVKQSAIDAESFHGIGFYLNTFSYRYYQAPPAPGADNGNAYFMFAEQVRAQANQYPAARLPSGEEVRVIKVMLPAAYALGGTSSVPGFYFRPFAEFVAGEDKHQRWDPAAGDYFVATNTQFDRARDVLAP